MQVLSRYQEGIGEGDYKTAAKWFRLAAKQEVAAAQLYLGWMYQQGKGVGQDYKEALKWLGLAAEQWSPPQNAQAQTLLGVMYAEGQGVTKNYETALKWFRLAAEHERAAAQYALGIMYHKGQGVPRDYETAEKWYKLAIAPRSVSTPNFSDTFEIKEQASAKNNLRILKKEIAKLKQQAKDKKGDFLSLEAIENKCTELGFSKGTEKHGDRPGALLSKGPRDTSPRLPLASNKRHQNGGFLLRDNQII